MNRTKLCCIKYTHHFIALDRTKEWNGFSLVHFTREALSGKAGLSEVKVEHYNWDQADFEILSCDDFDVKEKLPDADIIAIAFRMIDVIGDRNYDPVRYNCEHVTNYVMSRNLKSEQSYSTLAKACSVVLKNAKGVVLIMMAMICFCSAASGTIVRRAYEKLLVGLFIASKGNTSSYSDCTDPLGENVIQAADLLLLNQNFDPKELYEGIDGDFSATIIYLTRELENNSICEVASRLGWDALLKTTLYTFVTFIVLQTIYILCRTYFYLVPVRKSFAVRKLKFSFCKEIVNDIIGGISSVVFMALFGYIVQVHSRSPALMYFVVAAFAGMLGRYLILFIFEFFYHCCQSVSKCTCQCNAECYKCCGGHSSCTCACLCLPAVVLTVLLIGTIITFVVFHEKPCCWDPM